MIDGLMGAGTYAAPPTTLGSGSDMGKHEFLQLLVAQLRHQDPLNPMQSQDFAVQLAQFSTVEQLIGVNEQLLGQSEYAAAVAQAMNSSAAVGAIGHDVIASGSQVLVADGRAAVTVDVGRAGGNAVVRIYDDQDRLMGEIEVGQVGSGRQTLELDGLDGLDAGTYRYEINVTDADGDPVPTVTFVTGRVTGVKYGTMGPVLVIGAMEIPLGAVLEIRSN